LDESTGYSPFIAGVTFLKHPANSDKAKNKTDALRQNNVLGEKRNRKKLCHKLRDE
jgi:hypothetical protein